MSAAQTAAFALAALEDLKDELHRSTNKQFFTEHFVCYGDCRAKEERVSLAINLIRGLYPSDALSARTERQLAS